MTAPTPFKHGIDKDPVFLIGQAVEDIQSGMIVYIEILPHTGKAHVRRATQDDAMKFYQQEGKK